MEATQVEVNFLAKAIIGDFYLKLSKSQYTLQIALLITSGGTTPHPGQPMLAGVPILSQQWVYTSGVHNTTSPLIFKIDFLRGKKRAAGAYPREQI